MDRLRSIIVPEITNFNEQKKKFYPNLNSSQCADLLTYINLAGSKIPKLLL